MNKLLLILSFLTISCLCHAQLTVGKYEIISVSGFKDGKTIYENFFKDSTAIVRVTDNVINIVIAGYSANTYIVGKPLLIDGNYVYKAKNMQDGTDVSLVFNKSKKTLDSGIDLDIDGGILMVIRSENYSDVFNICKIVKIKE